MFIKIGETHEISRIENADSCIPAVNQEMLDSFKKTASALKKIAPKANDFLYFSAVMMHAAEAAALNEDGTPKLNVRGEAVQVGWDKTGNTWRWQTNDPNIKPYKNCFPPGTKILLENGAVKNIEDVEPGDMVITHKGRARKVLRKFITPHNDNLLQFNINNNIKLSSTDNHPLYRLQVSNNKWKPTTSKFRIWNQKNTNKEFSFVPAKDLDSKDFLLSINLNKKVDSTLTSNQARLLGLYAAEGSLNKTHNKHRNVVCFTYSADEQNTLGLLTKQLLESEFNNVNVTVKVDEKNHKCTVTAYQKDIYKFFLNHVGEYSLTKTLSPELVFGSDEVKQQFILGWLEGDGSIGKDTARITGTTISPNLASQVRLMLYSLGVHNTIYETPPSSSQINGREINGKHNVFRIRINSTNGQKIIKNSEKLNLNKTSKDRNLNKFIDQYCIHSILGVEKVFYSGDVYNLEVEEDNSYVANWIVVSNCNGDIFPEEELIKAHKKWVHKPLCIDHKSSSVDHTRGFIVDTYYDRNLKRVVALCALDKANYPDLAKKVASMMQTSVSMGTAVGRAICSDCGRVAKAEQDFCDHMRKKSCYGEINIDLAPIELSIVVNGADPKAHIKHIIAAANTLNTYVENKSNELNKFADVFHASISTQGDQPGDTANFTCESNTLDGFEQEIQNILSQVKQMKENANNGALKTDTQDSNNMMPPGIPQNARYASNNLEDITDLNSINELREVTAAIETKLQLMKNKLNKLANTSNIQEEQHMSGSNFDKRGYFQGGGGVNEPTPGQAKYTKDPLNEDMRMNGDKQMVGQPPFPGVGDVNSLHPSPESADESDELQRKKMLARAEAEERAMRRSAIVNMAKQALEDKRAYYQGGGGVNEPTPGKVKYPVDSLNMDARLEDKQMVGQKPFPGVGDVNSLHPSPASSDEANELKRKQMLSRAGLKARFVKAANLDGTTNFENSGWQVLLGDKLLLTASVRELSGGNTNMMYDSIATKDFGARLLEKVKSYGPDGVRTLVRQAQAAPPALPAPPAPAAPPAAAPPAAPPADMGAAAPAAPAAGEEDVEDEGMKGDPKETALRLSEKVRDLSSDLVEAVRALTGEKAEMGAIEELGKEAPEAGAEVPEAGAEAGGELATAASSFSVSTLNTLRKELNGALTRAMKESIAELNDHYQELGMLSTIHKNGSVNRANKELVNTLASDAFAEAKTAIADGLKLMTAFVKYARGTKALVKRAQMEASLKKTAQRRKAALKKSAQGSESDLAKLLNMPLGSGSNENLDMPLGSGLNENLFTSDKNSADDLMSYDDDGDTNDMDSDMVYVDDASKVNDAMSANPGKTVAVRKATAFDTKSGRSALRAKLAADALGKMDDGELHDMSKAEFSDMLDQAHRLTNGQTKLDVKPSDELGLVETVEERSRKMMDVATAPVKVRKEAEAIARLVSEGKLDTADFPALVAEGLDPAAVKYYKQYYGQVDGGSEFASELVKEHVKAQVEDELNGYRVKLARAYELAHEMVDRGLCVNDSYAVSAQVDEIMKFNDESFQSLKRVVAKHAPTLQKEAGRMPQVGMIGSGEVNTAQSDDWSQLSAAFAKTSKRLF